MTITTHAYQQLRRIAEDARDNREKAVITPDQLDDLLDAAAPTITRTRSN